VARLRKEAVRALESVARARSNPMPAGELARPALVFAPHPDDETLGCGGLIALKRQQSVPVDVVFLTDGRTSHRRFVAGDELAVRRRQEAIRACAALGVRAEAVTFLDFPDGELRSHRSAATAAVGQLLSTHAHRQIYVPYHGDTNADHMETRRIVLDAVPHRAFAPTATVCEYPVWFWFNWPWVAPPRTRPWGLPRLAWQSCAAAWFHSRDLVEHVDVRPVLSIKERALHQHRTQTVRPAQHPEWPVLADVAGGEWLQCFFTGREYFYRYQLTVSRAPRAAGV
jgi:LmbE family N-acetylglucosaminyl deacetylase